jgi:hypothetical protein
MGRYKNRQFKDSVGDWLINLDRFYSKFGEPDPVTGCIPWRGVKNNIGYPFIGVRDVVTDKYKMVTGHRVALTIKLGRAIRPGYNANHSVCHRKDCVNINHITEGTQREKLDQMTQAGIRGGRGPGPRGGYNHKQLGRQYKYSEAEIQWARVSPPADIAQVFGVPIKRAYQIKQGFRKGYCWLPLPHSGDNK